MFEDLPAQQAYRVLRGQQGKKYHRLIKVFADEIERPTGPQGAQGNVGPTGYDGYTVRFLFIQLTSLKGQQVCKGYKE